MYQKKSNKMHRINVRQNEKQSNNKNRGEKHAYAQGCGWAIEG